MTPKVDTFEHDIADEIRRKEANLAEIQAVSKQNSPTLDATPKRQLPWTMIILVIVLISALLGIGGVVYYYFNDSLLPPSSKEVTVTTNDIPKITAELKKISPTLGAEIGRFISAVEKKESGYILTITDYSAVFGYMTRNENAYIEELAALFGNSNPVTTTSSTPQILAPTPVVTTSTATQVTSTTTASTTVSSKKTTTKTASTTKISTLTPAATSSDTSIYTTVQPQSLFSDLTLGNQNMRVYKKGKNTVIYAFVGNKTVLISNTPEGILALKSAILR